MKCPSSSRILRARERRDAFDRVDVAAQPGEHRRLVARAGADLEHPCTAIDFQRLGHDRDRRRMGDGLPVADRQRPILVGTLAQRFVHKEMPWGLRHRPEDALVLDSPVGQPPDEPGSRAIEGCIASHHLTTPQGPGPPRTSRPTVARLDACPGSWEPPGRASSRPPQPQSERPDLNWRPPAPQAGALPGCATPRRAGSYWLFVHGARCVDRCIHRWSLRADTSRGIAPIAQYRTIVRKDHEAGTP